MTESVHQTCHDVVCNGNRDYAVGVLGHGCSCVSRYSWQLEEIKRLHQEHGQLQVAHEALKQHSRDTKPCEHCGWPKPFDDAYNICPCCGWEPGVDDKLAGPYQWDGTWWAPDSTDKPQIITRLEAQHAALLALVARWDTQQEAGCYCDECMAVRRLSAELRAHIEKEPR